MYLGVFQYLLVWCCRLNMLAWRHIQQSKACIIFDFLAVSVLIHHRTWHLYMRPQASSMMFTKTCRTIKENPGLVSGSAGWPWFVNRMWATSGNDGTVFRVPQVTQLGLGLCGAGPPLTNPIWATKGLLFFAVSGASFRMLVHCVGQTCFYVRTIML